MSRFDLHRWQGGLVVDVQTNLLSGLDTRIVVPLVPSRDAPVPAGRLNPLLEIDGASFALQPQLMGAVPTMALGPPIDNLLRHYDQIVAAIDMIFLGF